MHAFPGPLCSMPFLVWHASAYLYNMQILHILQDVLHDVLGDMLVLVVYAYSGSATPRASLRSWMSALVGHATSAVSVCTNKKKDIILCITSSAP